MYNYRLSSFVVFSAAFWIVEMLAATVTWAVLSYYIFANKDSSNPTTDETADPDNKPIKAESDDGTIDDMSDTERTFPTYGRQPPLRYSSPHIKKEESEEPVLAPLRAGEAADDEDESDDFVLDASGAVTGGRDGRDDSGIGTSMESGVEQREKVRKRRSGGLGGER
jgi:seipin